MARFCKGCGKEGEWLGPLCSPCRKVPASHNCEENAVPYKSDGALGHGWECGICGRFLQAG
jgi:hypothetical protein